MTSSWHYGYSLADRQEPNRRIYQYDRSINTNDPYTLSFKPEGNRRFFSDLDDTSHDLALSVRYDFGERDGGKDAPSFVQAGAALISRDRTVDTRRFKFVGPVDVPESLDQLFVHENIGPEDGQYQLANTTQATDDYAAEQAVYAGFLMGEYQFPFGVRGMAGARLEAGSQTVKTFSPFTGDEPVLANLENVDVLPAGSITWPFAPEMQFRFGYGRTVSRPEFRELSPARFDDVTNRRSVRGNPDVDRGVIDHYDVRWEWYLSPQETLSIAGFYKNFTDPIETMVTCGADSTITFRNSPAARNLGMELAVRKQLQFIGLSDVYVAGNVALIDSSVDLAGSDGCETSAERPLEGQSPYVLNTNSGMKANHWAFRRLYSTTWWVRASCRWEPLDYRMSMPGPSICSTLWWALQLGADFLAASEPRISSIYRSKPMSVSNSKPLFAPVEHSP